MKNNCGEPDYFRDMVKMVKDRKKILLLLERSFAGFRVIDGMELVCGVSGGGGVYNLEKRRLQPREAAAATT
jgi:hypothetical protein